MLRGGIDAPSGGRPEGPGRAGGTVAAAGPDAIIGGLEIEATPGGGGIDRMAAPRPVNVDGGGGKVPSAGGGRPAGGVGDSRGAGGGSVPDEVVWSMPGGGVSPSSVDFIDIDGGGAPAAGSGDD